MQISTTDTVYKSEKGQTEGLRGSKKRVSQFSYIKTAACFAIVVLHCYNNARVYHSEVLTDGQITTAYAVCASLMWAVPCFLMVTGALLLDRERVIPPSKLFGKYIMRMVVALVVFTAIFTVIKHDPSSGASIISEFAEGIMFNHCMAYLWYLYMMIAIYLLMPLFKAIVNRATDRQLAILTAVLLIVCSVLPLASYLGVDAALYIPTWIVYGAYLFIGFLLYRHNMDARIAAVLLVLCTITLPLITVKLAPTEIDSAGLTSYNSPLVVMQSAAAFSLMLRIKREAGRLIESIDRCSFGIYLIHMIFIRLTMKELGFNPFDYGPAGFIGASIVFFSASFAITYIFKRIKRSIV